MNRTFWRLRAAPVLLLAAAACRDAARITQEAPPAPAAAREVACVADRAAGTVRCGDPAPAAGASRVVMAVQDVHVKLESSAIEVRADTFTFALAIRNVLPQPLGTADGATPSPEGVTAYFTREPVATSGAGQVHVLGDGMGALTANGQPFFRYAGAHLGPDGILAPGETSAARRWKLRMDPGVQTFAFRLMVHAAVPFEDGWVEVTGEAGPLAPNAARALSARVRDVYGAEVAGAPVAWASQSPAVATVDALGVVTGKSAGTAVITATSGARTGSFAVKVQTGAPAALVLVGTDGMNVAPGQPYPDTVVARVVDAFGNPVQGVGVTWQARSGASVHVVAGGSAADGTVRAVWTVRSTAGGDTLRASLPGFTVPPLAVTAEVASRGFVRTWTGASATRPAAWNEAANWSPAGVPTALDTVRILAGGTPEGRVPTLSNHATVRRLLSGAAVDLGRATLTVLDTAHVVDAAFRGTGRLVLRRGGTLGGTFPKLTIHLPTFQDTVKLVGDVTVADSALVLEGAVNLNGMLLTTGDFSTTGRILMRTAADRLRVRGNAEFRISAEMTAGRVEVAGNFAQSFCTCGYLAGPAHVTVLNGTGPQTVTFGYPGLTGSSRFGTLRVENAAGVTFASTAYAAGSVVMAPGARATIPAGRTVGIAGGLTLEAGSAIANHGTLQVDGAVVNNSGTAQPVGPNPAL